VRGRIAEHQQREEAKAEQLREQIRKEEADKLAAEQAQAELAKAQAAPEGAELSPAAQALNEAQGAARFAEHHTKPAPAKKGKAKPARPTDDEIIDAISLHFRVHESKVIEWLLEVDLGAAAQRLVA